MHGIAMAAALYGTVIGSMFGGWPTDRFGRKPTLLFIGVLYLVGAVWSALAGDVYSFILARVIGGAILAAMRHKPRRPVEILALGAKQLLEFTVTQAADYWDVDRPVSRRDQKSGARKRSQAETEADLASFVRVAAE